MKVEKFLLVVHVSGAKSGYRSRSFRSSVMVGVDVAFVRLKVQGGFIRYMSREKNPQVTTIVDLLK